MTTTRPYTPRKQEPGRYLLTRTKRFLKEEKSYSDLQRAASAFAVHARDKNHHKITVIDTTTGEVLYEFR